MLTLVVFGCRARPGAHALLHTPHPAARGDLLPRHDLPPVGFQGPVHPLCQCVPGPHGVSCTRSDVSLTVDEKGFVER